MKITLKNFNVIDLFDEGTKPNKINGVHQCMSGAEYIVDIQKNELTYIGGASPMFVHEDFPIGNGLSPRQESLEKLINVDNFLIEYHNLCDANRNLTILDFNLDSPDIEGLENLLNHLSRISPNSWECAGKEAILYLIETIINKVSKKIGKEKFKQIMNEFFGYDEDTDNWKYLLTDFPELAENIDWDFYSPYGIDWVVLIKHNEKYAEKCDFNKLYIYDLLELINHNSSFLNKVDTQLLNEEEIELLNNNVLKKII